MKGGPTMRKTLFCGVDLHCNNAMYVITDGRDKQLFRKRLPNGCRPSWNAWSLSASGSGLIDDIRIYSRVVKP